VVIQSRVQAPGQFVHFCCIFRGDIPFDPGATDFIAQLIERSPADFQVARELDVGDAAESFSDVSTDRIDSIVGLSPMPEISQKKRPPRKREDDVPERVGKLPRYQLRIVPGTGHAANDSRRRSNR
jgi:hypothetical protein